MAVFKRAIKPLQTALRHLTNTERARKEWYVPVRYAVLS